MSFLSKFYEDDSCHNIFDSVSAQIAMLFENRYDNYFSYDFEKKEIIYVHEFFKIDPFLPEFAFKLKRAIEVFEPRVKDVSIKVKKNKGNAIIYINGNIFANNVLIKMPELSFNY